MKVLITAVDSKFIHSNLAVRYLKSFTRDMDYESKIKEFTINDREGRILEEIIKEKPDIVAFSTYIWNVELISRVANLIKRVDSNIEILYGGPEVSFDSRSFLKNNVGEYVIEGEGEKTYRDFILYKLGKIKLEDVRGLHYKINDIVYSNEKRPLMSMDEIVFPYEENEDLTNKIVYYEASRGCPFNCKYCLSSTSHGVRFLDIDRVLKDLMYFINKEVRLVKFVDRTFNCNSKFAMAIWDFLINQDTNTQFHFEISADILKPQEIELLSKAPKGRFRFEVGVQTTNDEVLRNINRFVNFSDIKEKVLEIEALRNIDQHLDLIAGLPGEDYESFKKSFNDMYEIKPEEIQLGFLKLLKGSSMREDAEKYGMEYSPYPPYEILKTDKISYEELLKLKKVEEMVDKYYNSQKFNHIIRYFERKFELPFDFYYSLGMFFEDKGYFSKNIGNAEYYKVFLDYSESVLQEDNKHLKEIIRFNYLIFNKKRGLPEFLRSDMEKEEEKSIKERLKEKYSFKEYYLEKFSINLEKYILNNEIIEEDSYYMFNNNNEYVYLKNI
ncbi:MULTISPECIES: B12-binding domain-containing radical SAM protein [Clostridium]|uniref:B12-binding domain-containing radical SAM protein n=1 Tax=Clostridium TaxID=1485 RepID=UPI000CDA69FC|nr:MULTISPECIES: B12-binding domain-containing radical SAM protein [Clostridium]MBN7572455.1 B12-binding domain-containing radical SAM protein [Clostridium beijerinckii]MBN7577399.1 B12-binding domain-containing radical SAM protein [Clostridium beijerinckii]MBN7582228.1 B12-binding domain-containing radical SAM protein [Clostridium beijerinckii]MBO0518574.1 B12-binding domain-containing radical SAM protein [Clostridium beijerinckii]POO93143.1 B12-binding domain-containing radical SAM protein [